ncbi:MAG: gfo/Idh/MocA family oxidoreductase, partial [Verrucomicrobia bacterium]|nr:gfo/Idh/MocA family oxidoreductase [Verrucomicrobiota bacterium]
EGAMYVGSEGAMLFSKILDDRRAQRFAKVPRTLPRRPGTWKEWFEACRGGEKAGCHFEWAGPLTETVLLGNIAIRRGRRLEWNAEKAAFVNDEEANRLVNPPYQNGWSLEKI